MDVEKLADVIRYTVGQYCIIGKCVSNCCRRHYIRTDNADEVRAVFGISADKAIEEHRDTLERLVVGDRDGKREYIIKLTPCPQLKDNSCRIHEHPDHPGICKDYPLFRRKDGSFVLRENCHAVKMGLVTSYFHQMARLGCRCRMG